MIIYNEDELTYDNDEPEFDPDDYEMSQITSELDDHPTYSY